jgi:hypothetical protein
MVSAGSEGLNFKIESSVTKVFHLKMDDVNKNFHSLQLFTCDDSTPVGVGRLL